MKWPTPAPGRELSKETTRLPCERCILRNGGRCDFRHKAIDLACMSGTIAHATHAAYAGLRIGRIIVGGNRSHGTTPSPNQRTRSFMGMAISTMGPNAPLRRPRPSIIRRFLPSKCRNLGTRKEGHARPSRRGDGRPKAAASLARKYRRRITSRRIAESRCRQPRRGCRRRRSAWFHGQ